MKSLILFHSKYGQTQKIAEQIADILNSTSLSVVIHNFSHLETTFSIEDYDLIVIGAPIYTSQYSRPLARFVTKNLDSLQGKITAFFSVSLAAAGDEKQRNEAIKCMNTFLRQVQWKPSLKTSFAGGLPYRKYNWFIRWLMKRIVRKAGGETDTSKNYEYTNWKAVASFAKELAKTVTASPPFHFKIQAHSDTHNPIH